MDKVILVIAIIAVSGALPEAPVTRSYLTPGQSRSKNLTGSGAGRRSGEQRAASKSSFKYETPSDFGPNPSTKYSALDFSSDPSRLFSPTDQSFRSGSGTTRNYNPTPYLYSINIVYGSDAQRRLSGAYSDFRSKGFLGDSGVAGNYVGPTEADRTYSGLTADTGVISGSTSAYIGSTGNMEIYSGPNGAAETYFGSTGTATTYSGSTADIGAYSGSNEVTKTYSGSTETAGTHFGSVQPIETHIASNESFSKPGKIPEIYSGSTGPTGIYSRSTGPIGSEGFAGDVAHGVAAGPSESFRNSFGAFSAYSASRDDGQDGSFSNDVLGPASYEFEYAVQDDVSGTNFGEQVNHEYHDSIGEYRVVLPDGRTQIVEYEADEGGYRPTIRYEETPESVAAAARAEAIRQAAQKATKRTDAILKAKGRFARIGSAPKYGPY